METKVFAHEQRPSTPAITKAPILRNNPTSRNANSSTGIVHSVEEHPEISERLEQSVIVKFGSANNFNGVPEPGDYNSSPLMVCAWAQTTSDDFSLVSIENEKKIRMFEEKIGMLEEENGMLKEENGMLKEESGKLKEEYGMLKVESGMLKEEIEMLKENLRAHTDLMSKLQATSARTTALLGQQHFYSSPHNDQRTAAISYNNMNTSSSRTPQIISPRNIAVVNSGKTSPHNSIINPLQHVNCSPADSVNYRIIAEGGGNQNDEPIEVQLAENDGAINLNSSADSGRLEICLTSEDIGDMKMEVNNENATPINQPLNKITTPNGNCHIKKRKATWIQSEIPSKTSNYFHNDQENIYPGNAQNNEKPHCSKLIKPRKKANNVNMCEQSVRVPGYDYDKVMMAIGPNDTLISVNLFESINWSSASIATRKLLMALFDRETLATHSMTGKPSPAFKESKPLKKMLNPRIVSDIIYAVTNKCNVPEKEVRNAITTKCADENKMMKQKQSKSKPMGEMNKENINDFNKK